MTTKHQTREAWLEAAVSLLTPLFTDLGHDLPPVRVSVGFAGGKGNRSNTIGQCWHPEASTDKVGQLFISPVLADALRVLDVLAHELVHAINHRDGDTGHGRPFARIAKALGLEGKMTATVAGEALTERLRPIATELGDYPHAALVPSDVPSTRKQGTRMLKLLCPCCGYTARTTAKWIERGLPSCPSGTEMETAS